MQVRAGFFLSIAVLLSSHLLAKVHWFVGETKSQYGVGGLRIRVGSTTLKLSHGHLRQEVQFMCFLVVGGLVPL